MQYRIKVTLPEVYHESICHWQPIHWTSNAVELDEEGEELTVNGLMDALDFGEAMSIEDDDGNTHIFPSELLKRCVVSLVRYEARGWYASVPE